MNNLRILYLSSEIAPFLEASSTASSVNALAHYMQEEGAEIRILVPRFGLIGERRNRLHEVVRLSGIQIEMAGEMKPLVIKVASIPGTRIQVYFIDNEEYFRRKAVFSDKEGNFFPDNGARMAFFCKGVLETVKKLGWRPEIVHCHDWITSLVPLYLRTTCQKDPLLRDAKTIFTLYNRTFEEQLEQDLLTFVKAPNLDENALAPLNARDFAGLIKTGVEHTEVVVKSEDLSSPHFKDALNGQTVKHIANDQTGIEAYHHLYQHLVNQ